MNPGEIEGYEVIAPLGQGGMGAVYRARRVSTGEEVALKVLRRSLATDEEFVLRFKREIAALSAVRHRGIARYTDAGTSGDVLYLAMEYVEGESLASRLREGPLPVREAMETAAAVAEALSAAHGAEIIHRDIKPSNIILSRDGAKITDFGLAKRTEGSGLTTSGRVMGSLPYMSPEQIKGEKLSGASDVYSLGVVLFEAVTGALPFSSEDDEALATMVLAQPVPIASRRRREVSAGLDLLLVRMMAKDAGLRPASAGEAAGKLRSIVDGRARRRMSEPARRRDGLRARVTGRIVRGAMLVLPVWRGVDTAAKALRRYAQERLEAGGAEWLFVEAAAARRGIRIAKREAAEFERKRDERLRSAEQAERRAAEAGHEERQALERTAARMRGEAEIFGGRTQEAAGEIAGEEKRARRLEERAAVLGAGKQF